MSIKLIMFDLDDTLINTAVGEYNTLCEFKKLFNQLDDISNEDFAKKWHDAADVLYDEYYAKKISMNTLRNRRVKQTLKEYGFEITEDESIKRFQDYLNIYEKNWLVYEDTFEVLEKLSKEYKLAIVTNGDPKLQNDKIDGVNLRKYFSKIVVSGDYEFSKPDPRIFELVLNEYNLKPEECIMVGDKYNKDIIGSSSIGIKSIWINRKNKELDYEYQVKSLSEMIELI